MTDRRHPGDRSSVVKHRLCNDHVVQVRNAPESRVVRDEDIAVANWLAVTFRYLQDPLDRLVQNADERRDPCT